MRTTQTVPEFGHIQDGTTWLGGPTHELQKQHIPGYMGHVHSLFAENVHGKNFARVTSECLNQRATVGIDVTKVSLPHHAGRTLQYHLPRGIWQTRYPKDSIRCHCRKHAEQYAQN